MKWSSYIAQWMTLIFGVTPPKLEDERRYAWTVIGLFATLINCAHSSLCDFRSANCRKINNLPGIDCFALKHVK